MKILHDFVARVQRVAEDNMKIYHRTLFTDPKHIFGGERACHGLVVKLLKRAGSGLPSVAAVSAEDKTLHRAPLHGGWKPDIILWDASNLPLLVVEYESLNSSDERVFEKDIWKYQHWAKSTAPPLAPLLIITTLHNGQHPEYPSAVINYAYNREHRGRTSEIRNNPFLYWYDVYRSKIGADMSGLPIAFANFDENRLSIVPIDLKREAEANAKRPPVPITDREWDSNWWIGPNDHRPLPEVTKIRHNYKLKLRGKTDLSELQDILRAYWEEEQLSWNGDCWTTSEMKGFLKDVERIRNWQDAVRVIVNVQSNKY